MRDCARNDCRRSTGLPALLAAILLALAACQTADDPAEPPSTGDLALIIAFDTAFGTLQAFVATGDVSTQAVEFMDALVAYGDEGCAILGDPATTPEQKRLALLTDLADERAAFDAAFLQLGSSGLDPRLIPAVEGAKSAARLFAAYRTDPEFWMRPCGTVSALAATWAQRRPVA
jgi:hypothetical protein